MTNIYDPMKEKGKQIAIFQAQISGLQAELEALRVAARILNGGGGIAKTARPVPVPATVAAADQSKQRVWP